MIRKKSLKKSKRITKLKPTKIKHFQTKKPTPKSRTKQKWADFLISGVAYRSNGLIDVVRRHFDDGDTVRVPGHIISRIELATDLVKGITHETTYYYDDLFHRGHRVKHYVHNGKGYIRTTNVPFEPTDYLG